MNGLKKALPFLSFKLHEAMMMIPTTLFVGISTAKKDPLQPLPGLRSIPGGPLLSQLPRRWYIIHSWLRCFQEHTLKDKSLKAQKKLQVFDFSHHLQSQLLFLFKIGVWLKLRWVINSSQCALQLQSRQQELSLQEKHHHLLRLTMLIWPRSVQATQYHQSSENKYGTCDLFA